MKKHYGNRKLSMPVERVPSEKLYLDWVGDQPELMTDPEPEKLARYISLPQHLDFQALSMRKYFLIKNCKVSSLWFRKLLFYYIIHFLPFFDNYRTSYSTF